MHRTEQPVVIAIGETMALVTPVESEPLETASLFHLDIGGAESNVATHLVALGHHAAWVGQLGDDALGRRVARQLGDHDVDTRWLRIDRTAPTGVYFKDPGNDVIYFRRDSAASRMSPETLRDIPIEQADIVHISGITPALSESCADLIASVLERMRHVDSLVSFDVNFRQGLWDASVAAKTLLGIANQADVVFVGLDEAHILWGTETAADVRRLISSPLLIVKDSSVGATEFDGGTSNFVESIPSEVIEAVGAGDAFAAGYLAAHLSGATSTERLRAGHQRAVLALQSTRDVPSSSDGR